MGDWKMLFDFKNGDENKFIAAGVILAISSFVISLHAELGFLGALIIAIIVFFIYCYVLISVFIGIGDNGWCVSLPISAFIIVWSYSSLLNGLLAAGAVSIILVIIYLAEKNKYEQKELEKRQEAERLEDERKQREQERISESPYKKMKCSDCYYYHEEDGNFIAHCKITEESCPYEEHADVCKYCHTFYTEDWKSNFRDPCPYVEWGKLYQKQIGIKKAETIKAYICKISSETAYPEGKCRYPNCVSCSKYQSKKPYNM